MAQTNQELEEYVEIVGNKVIEELYRLAEPLKGRRILMVNSTKNGGGVAELLNSLVPLFERLGIQTSWLELKAPSEFFDTTKAFHNALQGDPRTDITDHIAAYQQFYERGDYALYNKAIVEALDTLSQENLVVIHDPQPLWLINQRRKDNSSKWVWRCHIDIGDPHPKLWEFVNSLAAGYDKIIVSKDSFIHGDEDKYAIIPPSIDPFTEKNKTLSDQDITAKLTEYGIPTHKPIVAQISRFDKWKDPIGVIEAYKEARKAGTSCSLVLLGNLATDDPEGQTIYEQVLNAKCGEYSQDIYIILKSDPLLVNALQRTARVVLQKSLREGFALTVSEALWKGTPVIATEVGGIPLQVQHGKNGYLVKGYDINSDGSAKDEHERQEHITTVADYITKLVSSPDKARNMGRHGQEHVKQNFLITRHLRDYLSLFNSL